MWAADCGPVGGQDPFSEKFTIIYLISNFQESRSIPQTNNSETKKKFASHNEIIDLVT